MIFFMFILLLIIFYQIYIIFNLYKQVKELENAPLDNRARNAKGKFVMDDPKTPENEAYKPRKKK